MNFLKTLVSDDTGAASTMRVATLLVIVAVLTNWVYLTIHIGYPQPLDWQTATMVIGTLGAKAVQSKFESQSEPPAPPAQPPKV